MVLKELRVKYDVTIEAASRACGVPTRTYLRYEKDDSYGNALKRKAIINSLMEKFEITEYKGIYSIEKIKSKCVKVFNKYRDKITYCYLFGSYAKGYAKDNSDVDLLISTELTGFDFLSLIEEIKQELNKKIDLLRFIDIKDNTELLNEIMKDGVKIYG